MLYVAFGLLLEEGFCICVELEVEYLPICPRAVCTVLLLPVIVGLWVAFDVKECLGCHDNKYCVRDVLLNPLILF